MALLVTAGPPTSNGDLHLGHLSGPYLAGDVLARFQRLLGEDVTYISAADDHQSYVARAAAKAGRPPAEVAAENCARIQDTLERAGIEMDLFAAPAQSERYIAFVQEVFRTLRRQDVLVERVTEAPYCEACDRYLFEAHIRGGCPHCGAPSDGGICEACGKPNSGSDLTDPVCAACGKTPTTRALRQFWFPLERYRAVVRQATDMMVLPPRARALVADMLAAPLPDVPVTQPADWGIAVPAAGYEDQRISAWFELGPHYLAITDLLPPPRRQRSRGWRDHWTGFDRVIQAFGFDSIYFHTILFPAIFHAFDPMIRPPAGVLVNEFLRLDGRKFSTSRDHALWAGPFLSEHAADPVRYHLARVRPEITQTNFTLADFARTRDEELGARWDGWLIDLGRRVAAAGGQAPAVLPNRDGLVFLGRIAGMLGDLASCYGLEGFCLSRAAATLSEMVGLARRFREEQSAIDGRPALAREATAALAAELAAARALALAAAPLMPDFAARLWRDLGNADPVAEARWEVFPIAPLGGTPLTLSEVGYFAAGASPSETPAAPEAPEISAAPENPETNETSAASGAAPEEPAMALADEEEALVLDQPIPEKPRSERGRSKAK